MSYDKLTMLLAERVMGWGVGPDRFTLGNRRWIAHWRFRPAERIEDAFRLLEAAAPEQYTLLGIGDGTLCVRVRIAGAVGEAQDACKPRAITLAVARALGIQDPPDATNLRHRRGEPR